MAFVDVKNKNGDIQTVPEHYLEAFPGEFKLAGPAPKSTPANADTKKEAHA